MNNRIFSYPEDRDEALEEFNQSIKLQKSHSKQALFGFVISNAILIISSAFSLSTLDFAAILGYVFSIVNLYIANKLMAKSYTNI